jgi:hypothetical protein
LNLHTKAAPSLAPAESPVKPPLWSSGQTSWLQTEVPDSIPGAARLSDYQWVWNGVHSALERINEKLLERKVVAPV